MTVEGATLEDAHRKLAEALRNMADVVEALASVQLPQPKDRALPFKEVAAVIGRKLSSVYRAVETGALPTRLLNGEPVVLLSELNDFMKRLPLRNPRRVRLARAKRELSAPGGFGG